MTKKDDNCFSGACPTPVERDMNTVKLSEGSGGREMQALIDDMRARFPNAKGWGNLTDDGATYPMGGEGRLVFTSDSYVVTPIFFPGGNIGKIAFCGTVNDLAVMGARPIGLSLSFVLEEGLPKRDLFEIVDTIAALSRETGIPIVTGDTKVIERRGLDKIIINTSGVGVAERVFDAPLSPKDAVIVSGGVGEHGTALLAKRFELESAVETDSKPLFEELSDIAHYVKQAKDVTRGGLAAILNELAKKNDVGFALDEERVPMREEVRALTEILGIDAYGLACEGRFVAIVAAKDADATLAKLRKHNPMAAKIGEVVNGTSVVVTTAFGKKLLPMPSGNIVPRIC